MNVTTLTLTLAILLPGLAGCDDPRPHPELADILARLPGTTQHCCVLRSLEEVCRLSVEYGPAVSQEMVDWLLLPAPPEDLTAYRSAGIAVDRPLVFAQLTGDPTTAPEHLLVIIPVSDPGAVQVFLARQLRERGVNMNYRLGGDFLSPHDYGDMGTARVMDDRWLVVALTESYVGFSDPGAVADQFSVMKDGFLGERMEFDGLLVALPDDWSLFLFASRPPNMVVRALGQPPSSEVISFWHASQWFETGSTARWVERDRENGWLHTVLVAMQKDVTVFQQHRKGRLH